MQPVLPHKGIHRAEKREIYVLTTLQGRPRLKQAIADAHSQSFGRTLNPDTEVSITTGANEGIIPYILIMFVMYADLKRNAQCVHGLYRKGR